MRSERITGDSQYPEFDINFIEVLFLHRVEECFLFVLCLVAILGRKNVMRRMYVIVL